MNRTFRAFFVVILLAVLSAIHLTIHSQNIQRSYTLNKLNDRLEILRNNNRFLSYKVSKKESLERIENIATTKLNMVYPKSIKYLIESTKESE